MSCLLKKRAVWIRHFILRVNRTVAGSMRSPATSSPRRLLYICVFSAIRPQDHHSWDVHYYVFKNNLESVSVNGGLVHLMMLIYLRIPMNFTMHCIIPINPLSLLYFKNELCKNSSTFGAEKDIRSYILHLIVSETFAWANPTHSNSELLFCVGKKERSNSNIAGIFSCFHILSAHLLKFIAKD